MLKMGAVQGKEKVIEEDDQEGEDGAKEMDIEEDGEQGGISCKLF